VRPNPSDPQPIWFCAGWGLGAIPPQSAPQTRDSRPPAFLARAPFRVKWTRRVRIGRRSHRSPCSRPPSVRRVLVALTVRLNNDSKRKASASHDRAHPRLVWPLWPVVERRDWLAASSRSTISWFARPGLPGTRPEFEPRSPPDRDQGIDQASDPCADGLWPRHPRSVTWGQWFELRANGRRSRRKVEGPSKRLAFRVLGDAASSKGTAATRPEQ
jgi:hypothetical protein